MRVGLDTTALFAGNAGVARYVRELASALDARSVELVPFAIGRGTRPNGHPRDVRHVRVPLRLVHRSWSVAGVPSGERLAPGCDVVHAPDLVPPPYRGPLVVTVHDLDALAWPGLHPRRAVDVQRRQLAAARDRAAVVLSVSHATAAALRAHGVDAQRILVTPNGVTALPAPDMSRVPSDPYVLAVGSVTPRKGLPTLAAAFARAALPAEVRLVIGGGDGWRANEVLEAIRREGPSGRVVRTGPVTDAQLAGLYARCLAVCVPSCAEGFGLPVIEAAAAGAPVVASDLPVFRELGEAVALHAPAGDADAWAAALERIVGDAPFRRSAAERAGAVAREYTWDRTATATIAAYERAREAA